jgi:hypothetical protein
MRGWMMPLGGVFLLAGRMLLWLLRLAGLTVYVACRLVTFLFFWWLMLPYYLLRSMVRAAVRYAVRERGLALAGFRFVEHCFLLDLRRRAFVPTSRQEQWALKTCCDDLAARLCPLQLEERTGGEW